MRNELKNQNQLVANNSVHKGAGPTFLVYGNHQRAIFWVHIG